jgi:hypothetical protein
LSTTGGPIPSHMRDRLENDFMVRVAYRINARPDG